MRRSPSRWGSGGRSTRGFFNFGINPVFAIIAANLVFYIATLIAASGKFPVGTEKFIITDKFTYYLGLIPYYFTERPWTFFTAMFIHIDFWHLFGNMITLFFFGSYLSRLVGNTRFTIVYFVGGIIGNIVYLVFGLLGDSATIAVGASGAVYAVAGALVVLVPNLRIYLYFLFPMPLWVVIIIFFVLWSIPGVIPGIAWQAHLGGLVVGLIFGYYFRRKRLAIY